MSETSTPAGGTGGDNSTSARPELAELPAKVRVHALAKLLGKSSREVMDALDNLGQGARSAQSSVTKDTALQVADALLGSVDPVGLAGLVEEAAAEPAAPVAAPTKQPPPTPVFATASPLFLPPTEAPAPVRPAREEPKAEPEPIDQADEDAESADVDDSDDAGADGADDGDEGSRRRRRRGRRGRGRGKGGADDGDDTAEQSADAGDQAEDDPKAKDDQDDSAKSEKASEKSDDAEGDEGSKRRRRRRRRKGNGEADSTTEDDPPNTVVHVRESREAKPETSRDEVRSVRGSTRLEAKRQRRRDGREAGRRRAPILSESEFLARREAVDRTMVVRERPDRTQIAVLEDGVLVEHFVTSAGSGSMVGNVYLGRVQNVLPSMEAAFVDIGRGRNAVLYAGEVDWDAAGLEGKARRIEQALSTGDSVLVQVTKDPVGHKGARLTTQISLPGRFLVYVPGGGATGISRKLPENERRRLKDVLKRIVPEDAGVIIRTASEGVSEEELARDVRRLQAQWQVIKDKVDAEASNKGKKSSAPTLLYEEPDLLVKVVRDLFTEDFAGLVVQGADAWDTIDAYVRHVAPELTDRVRRHVGPADVFNEHRIDEQLLKALDRKVWLPSGGYLVIDRTEAMTVIDVNTGKFTGSGGNLEETVTRNNLESAEEIVRQLRLRDIGGIIVIDFIDMVLEANRDLVLRRLTECLGRDRTRHQVAEVTSLGLVQMTRKRVGTGLLEAFSTPCEHCKGRGVIVSTDLEAPANGGHQHQHAPANGKRNGRDHGKSKDTSTKDTKDARDKAPDPDAPGKGTAVASTSAAASTSTTEPAPAESASAAATPLSTEAPAAAAVAAGTTDSSAPVDQRSTVAPHAAADDSTQAGPEAGSPQVNSAPAADSTATGTGSPAAPIAGSAPVDAGAPAVSPSVEAVSTPAVAPATSWDSSSDQSDEAESSSAPAAIESAAPTYGTAPVAQAETAPQPQAEAPTAGSPVTGSEPAQDAAESAQASVATESEPAGSAAAKLPAEPAQVESAAAESVQVDGAQERAEQATRRRRHGKVVRPAGAPAPVVAPAVEVSVPPVPEGQSRVLVAPEESLNGHEAQAETPAENVVSSAAASEADGPEALALPRRHQPRRAVSRPAGPPVHTPGEPS
ncbi:translation initiation factor IF-2 N-terminal domain-containing protein [Labedaea rhizosphaerae]|uniref:Ribonuclease E n=1 Tax=Labedaea rhizosphaerae TaxID=598644 RepID=A0A4R6S8L3_LABRH|nr:translation initiation factor IF-2 N-terminal domain-containing protein [Labedaea rhizosphaerae]TDP96319.1 ribonuclease E [Labedaea rhizosphaerae]